MAFNRDISSKLGEKLRSELGDSSPETSTIHTFILRQIHDNGKDLLASFQIADDLGECGKEKLLWTPISKRLKEVHGIKKTSDGKRLDIRHVKGELWKLLTDYWLTSRLLDDPVFEKFKYEVDRLRKIYKIVFLDELAIKFLDALVANPSFRRSVAKPRIIIDEFQDLNPTEHQILLQLSQEGTTFLVLGDDDQAVNDFRHAHADYIRAFMASLKPTEYPLPRDRRCPEEILDLADEFVKGLPRLDKLIGHAPHKGRTDILAFSNDEKEKSGIANLVKRYLSVFQKMNDSPQVLILAGNTGTITGKSRIAEIIQTLKEAGIDGVTGEQKDPLDSEWGLAFKSLLKILIEGNSPSNLAAWLAVTNPRLMKIVNDHIVEEERTGNSPDFLQATSNVSKQNPAIKNILRELDALKEKIKDAEFAPNMLVEMIPEKLDGRSEGQALVDNIWNESQTDASDGEAIDSERVSQQKTGQRFLQSLTRYMTENVRKQEIGRVHVTTYRKAKGLEADFVIVTSVDSSDFFDNPQKRRLLYVAATRAKKNLILTFADKRTKARRFTRGRDEKSRGTPRVFRSPLIPSKYRSEEYSERWLLNWVPV